MKMFDIKYRFVKARIPAYINRELPAYLRRYVARQIDTDVRCRREYQQQRALSQEIEHKLAFLPHPSRQQKQYLWHNIEQAINAPQSSSSKKMMPILGYSVAVVMLVLLMLSPLNSYLADGVVAVPSQPAPVVLVQTATPTVQNEVTMLIATRTSYTVPKRVSLANTPAPISPQS
jgi:anti-sigma factor RsiW